MITFGNAGSASAFGDLVLNGWLANEIRCAPDLCGVQVYRHGCCYYSKSNLHFTTLNEASRANNETVLRENQVQTERPFHCDFAGEFDRTGSGDSFRTRIPGQAQRQEDSQTGRRAP